MSSLCTDTEDRNLFQDNKSVFYHFKEVAMKTKLLVSMWLVGLCVGVAGFLFAVSQKASLRHDLPAGVEASVGTPDDPVARARYEWLRLHDPATGHIPANIRENELAFASTLPTKESIVSSMLSKSPGPAANQLLTWSSRGPNNVGGRTRALALDVTNENIILAGGVSGGLWRSTNGGTSWTKVSSLSGLQSVTSIAQDTRSGQTATWYYSTGEYVGNSASGGSASYRGDGIFKSTDSGLTWSQLASTVSGTPQSFDQAFDYVWNVLTDPSNGAQAEVYASTYGGIYKSTNGGTSWSLARGAFPGSPYTDVAIIPDSGIVYATLSSTGTNPGIWRSRDGTTWTSITPAGWPATYNRVVVAIAPSNKNVAYFIAETPGTGVNGHSFWKYTYVSGDGSGGGGTWVNRSANLPAVVPPVGGIDSQGSYDLIAKVKPDNENVVFIGGTNLFRSTDGFATTGNTTWIGGYAVINNISRYANHHPDQHSLVFLPSSSITMISGHDGGLSKTTNNLAGTVVWTFLNNGYQTTQFYTLAIDHATSGNNIIIGGMQDNGTWFTNTTVATTPWLEEYSGDGAYCAIANGRSSYYVSAQNGLVYRFLLGDDGLPSASPYFTRVDPTGGTGYLFINPFVLDPNNSTMMYLAGGDRPWRNSNLTGIPMGSISTTTVNWTDLTSSQIVGAIISALGISTTPANRLYFGTHNGKVYRLDGANSGLPAPTDIWTGKGFPAGAYVSCIAVSPTNADTAMVAFSNYSVVSVFFTSNGGTTWTSVAGNLEQFVSGTGNGPSCRWAAIVPRGGTTYYFVGTSTGLYSTTTLSGTSTVWALEGASPIGNAVVDMIDVRQSDGLIVAGTHGQGVYSGTVPVTSVELVENTTPSSFSLGQNYPNPFNPSTTIRYEIPNQGNVQVKVFDLAGREIVSLVDAAQTPGTYTVTWDGKDRAGNSVASGIYFYRLQAGGFSETKRLAYLR